MAKKLLVFFGNEKDLQMSLNSMVQAGFNSEDVSLIMKDNQKNKLKMAEPYDEENAFGEARGTMWATDAENLDTEAFVTQGIGSVVVAGPVLNELDELEVEDSTGSNDSRFYDVLKLLGIVDQEIGGIEQRINNGEILACIDIDENIDEKAMLFSDNGGYLLNYDTPLN
jgi:hypothetical protein